MKVFVSRCSRHWCIGLMFVFAGEMIKKVGGATDRCDDSFTELV